MSEPDPEPVAAAPPAVLPPSCPRCGYARVPEVGEVRRCPECAQELPADAMIIPTGSPIALAFTTTWCLVVLGAFWSWMLVRLGMLAGWFPLVSGVFWILLFVAGFWWVQRRRAGSDHRGRPSLLIGSYGLQRWRGGLARETVPWGHLKRWSLRPTPLGRRLRDGTARWILTIHPHRRSGRLVRWPRLVVQGPPELAEAIERALRDRCVSDRPPPAPPAPPA